MRRIKIEHVTEYVYPTPVQLLKHRLLIRPREGHDLRIESSRLSIEPSHTVTWHRDVYGNSVASVEFGAQAQLLRIASEIVVQHYGETLPTWVAAEDSAWFPFRYEPMEQTDLMTYLLSVYPQDSARLGEWLRGLWNPGGSLATLALLNAINKKIESEIQYEVRHVPGVQSPAQTLSRKRGSCRDMATLFIEACRYCGVAARFVSGYLLSSATVQDLASTHAWSEVYFPAGGWRGFDSTSGRTVTGEHVAVAVHRHPEAIPPVAGAYLGPAEPAPSMRVEVRAMPV